ncbi:hypothetical protein V5O48_017970 [Marasmius crinis-equi]|uniref:Uncharacterized protein n=1 Tax=Marasmius crinis-equi TaxID=585013 RepID=A0ABR3EMG9_9AGAR
MSITRTVKNPQRDRAKPQDKEKPLVENKLPTKRSFQAVEESEIETQELPDKARADAEVDAWAEKSDKVQFFRTEAEYEHVREELEFKHASFGNSICFFAARRDQWKTAVKMTSDTPGKVAYALEKAAMYEALRADCHQKFKSCGLPGLVNIPEGKILADQVQVFRDAEEQHFPHDRYSNRPKFCDPTVHAHGFNDTREGAADEKE